MTECERLIEEGFIEESFLSAETRNDYYISTEMKKVWAIELDLLSKLSEVCKKHNLRFWVCYGTLLGTIRHKGFVPWDDDMDIWLPRKDYDQLCNLSQNEWAEPYFFQTTLNDKDYYSAFARLRNSNTTGILVSKNNKCNNGIYIDIYPIDGLSNNRIIQRIRSFVVKARNVSAHAYLYNVNPHPVSRQINRILHFPGVHFSVKNTYLKNEALEKKVDWYAASEVGLVATGGYSFKRNIFRKSWFDNTIWMPFEFLTVPVPEGYDHILETQYGAYMELPPPEKRGTWHRFEFDPDTPYAEK